MIAKKISDVDWEDHFMTDKGKIKWILTRERDDSPITVMKVHLEKGRDPARSCSPGSARSDLCTRGKGHYVH